MKIERLSENQIRCTLNKSDLSARQLKISELAYGSDKAKELFRDMMQQAANELGFEADDIPLMIEAIPVSSDCVVLIVTKVDDPEELDTRFSKFSSSNMDDYDDYPYGDDMEVIESDDYRMPTARDELDNDLDLGYDNSNNDNEIDLTIDGTDVLGLGSSEDVINLFSKVKDYLNQSISDMNNNNSQSANSDKSFVPLGETLSNKPKQPDKHITDDTASEHSNPDSNGNVNAVRVFLLDTLDIFSEASKAILPLYSDFSSLYKLHNDNHYYLVLKRSSCTAINFNKTCNILSEYSTRLNSTGATLNYFEEHGICLIKKHAIQIMSRI